MVGVRMAVVWCPDWPVVSWGVPIDEPAIVTVANRVVASSPAARAEGVRIGQRRRDAQSRCPEVAVLERDAAREARLFEPVVATLDTLTPRIEVSGPGLAGFPTRGPSRFFGGDHALAERMLAQVEPVLARRGEARVGIADGVFAARLAARSRRARTGPLVIEPEASQEFLAGISVETLELPELTDVLTRLGLLTLGSLAGLSAGDVVGRFGQEGRLAHRLAQGEDDYPPDLRRPAPDLAVTWQFEPPAERIESCAFVAKMLADDLHTNLLSEGLACTRVAIEVETEAGDTHSRLWRHEGALSAAAIADRTRWQLDGWLRAAPRSTPDDGLVRLTLIPDEVVAATGRQLGFWGTRNERGDDVTRAVARLQAMLGPEAVTVPEHRGGLSPADRIALVPAAAVDLTEERPATASGWVAEPWPGHIPAPAPAHLPVEVVSVEVLDHQGRSVGVDGRGKITAPPALMVQDGTALGSSRAITGWAGPWPADQRWWDP
ncbi:MAG: DNA polymerase Y family protein, partial [Acidimicrobiia bacterium]|nr:DNA polymerase Y family protein [Acidimicrobiia bacterium]